MSNFQVTRMSALDVPAVLELMRADELLAFCSWENEVLLRSQLNRESSVMLVAKAGEVLIGALIGGTFGCRGMICHVAAEKGGNGVGTQLLQCALTEFRERKVSNVHLIVTSDNEGGRRFWRRRKFTPDSTYVTLERDVADETLESNGVVDFSTKSSDIVHKLIHGLPIHPTEWRDRDCLERSIADPHCHILGRDDNDTKALQIAGSFGFRAQISALCAASEADFKHLVSAALSRFRDEGVYRVHVRIHPNDASFPLWNDLGFQQVPGETTFDFVLL